MKAITFSLFISILFTCTGFAQTKKVKIKGDRSVSFYYEKDSTCLDRKETIELVRTFYSFYKVIANDDYEGYLDHLSPVSKSRIKPEKLKRKYGKFRGYAVKLIGKIKIRFIMHFDKMNFKENSPLYICAVRLPDGQKIEKRVGFDPIKKMKIDEPMYYIGSFLVKTEDGYKIVIPW